MKAIGIENIEYHLPLHKITSHDLCHQFGFDIEFIENKVGIKNLYEANPEENTADLAVLAAKKIIQKRPEILDKIGLIVVCNQTGYFDMPHTAAVVQNQLGIKRSIPTFDLSLGCSGFMYGQSIIRSFMNENEIEYGLLITSETYSKFLDDQDKNTKCIFSDAACATLFGPKPKLSFEKTIFGTSGKHFDVVTLSRHSKTDVNTLKMNGRGIFEFVAKEIPGDIHACLDLNRKSIDDINYFVFHQASAYLLSTLQKRLKLQENKVINYMGRFGNTVSSTVPMVLKDLLTELDRKDNPSQLNLLASGFGVGLSWATSIIKTKGDYWNV